MSDSVSRRTFLSRSAAAGLGAATVGAGGLLAGSVASTADAASPALSDPPQPSGHRTYTSRPDLLPPVINITTQGLSSGSPDYIFVAPRVAVGGTYPKDTQPGLLIMNNFGDVIWFNPQTGTNMDPFNFGVQTYKGKAVLTWFQGTVGDGYATSGEYVIMDNTYSQVTNFQAVGSPSDLHEFNITPQDTALVTSYDSTSNSGLVVGHAQEIDIASKAEVFDWACYPTVATSNSYVSTGGDYFHINSIDLWPGSARNLLISSRDCCAVYLIDRSTKKVIWQIGGKKNSFKMGDSTAFAYQHHARALTDGSGISMFDDASQPFVEKQSWGKVFTVDQETMDVTLRHQMRHTTSVIDTASQGSCQLLPNGGHFIGWGANPYFSEYAPSGSAVQPPQTLDGRYPTGVESYRAFKFNWTGNPPLSQLAFVVHKGSASGSFTGFASWNGATEITNWSIWAGAAANTLQHVTTVPKGAFEAVVSFTHSGATAFQATAHNASGQILGRSNVVSAS